MGYGAYALRCQPRVFVELGQSLGLIGFAQQAACGRAKAWVEKMLVPAATVGRKTRRWQQVHAFDIIFGA